MAGITVPYRIRFDECGPDGVVRTSALLRYAQDVAWIHSERLGFDRPWYAERGLAWVVRAAELAIVAPVSLGDTLSISTAITGFRKVWARRRTEARLADGTARPVGAHGLGHDRPPGPARARAARVPGGVRRARPGRSSPAASRCRRRRPTPSVHVTRVRPQDLDPMGHVNNAAYLDYLEEALAAAGGRGARGDRRHAAPGAARVRPARGAGRGPRRRRVAAGGRGRARLGMAPHRSRGRRSRARPGARRRGLSRTLVLPGHDAARTRPVQRGTVRGDGHDAGTFAPWAPRTLVRSLQRAGVANGEPHR